MPELELTSPTTATGIWALADYVDHLRPDGTRRTIQGYGHYFEEYRKVDGTWKIAKLELRRLRVDDVPDELRGPFPG
jgi:hypothetical protein